jgi:hypothetical protein
VVKRSIHSSAVSPPAIKQKTTITAAIRGTNNCRALLDRNSKMKGKRNVSEID